MLTNPSYLMIEGTPPVTDILSYEQAVPCPGVRNFTASLILACITSGFEGTLRTRLRAVLYFCEDRTLQALKRDEKLS
jgi:hypothetical protein